VSGNTLTKDSRFADETTLKYDKGNLVELTKIDGLTTSYVWGYTNNTYPVAKVIGKDYNNVYGILTNSILTNPASDQALRDELQKIRQQYPAALTSTYTYQKLVGMTSETDPRNISQFYQYDALGRLSNIRDLNNYVLKKYCYNYKGQAENCVAGGGGQMMMAAIGGDLESASLATSEEPELIQHAPEPAPEPTCSPQNCTGPEYRCVNGQCEQGYKVYTGSVFDAADGKYTCTYHYEWSDGSWSINYTKTNNYSCTLN
jgi:YD repeat-containing protein